MNARDGRLQPRRAGTGRRRRHRRGSGRHGRGDARARAGPRHRAVRRAARAQADRSIASVTETPVQRRAVLGRDYWHGAELAREFLASGAIYVPGTTVWSLSREREIGISRAGGSQLLEARRVIIATGALERPFPIPGWTLPGVMTAGAAQILLKSGGLAPEGRTVLAGCGPLLWLIAAQYLRAGRDDRPHPRHHQRREPCRSGAASLGVRRLAVLRQGPGAARRGAQPHQGDERGDGAARRGAGTGRARGVPARRWRRGDPAGRHAAAAPGRRAERQPGDVGRHRASLGRRAAVLDARDRCGRHDGNRRHRDRRRRRGHRRRAGGGVPRPARGDRGAARAAPRRGARPTRRRSARSSRATSAAAASSICCIGRRRSSAFRPATRSCAAARK